MPEDTRFFFVVRRQLSRTGTDKEYLAGKRGPLSGLATRKDVHIFQPSKCPALHRAEKTNQAGIFLLHALRTDRNMDNSMVCL